MPEAELNHPNAGAETNPPANETVKAPAETDGAKSETPAAEPETPAIDSAFKVENGAVKVEFKEVQTGLVIPDEAIPYVRYQRSRYKAEKVPDDNVVRERYTAHVQEDFDNMKPHLPQGVKRFLEIGCGCGSLTVHLARHYPDAEIHLLDGDTVTNQGGAGYAEKSDIYNSRAVTEAMLAANGITRKPVWHDIGTREVLEFDFVVSLASCGFHFPVSTYNIKSPAVIMDLRRGPEKVRGQIIFNGPKYERCLFAL